MKAGNLIIGVLSGAVAGLAAGMLFAPKKGVETRRRIADRSNEYVTGTKHKFNDILDNVSHTFDTMKSKTMGKSKKMQPEMNGDEKIIY